MSSLLVSMMRESNWVFGRGLAITPVLLVSVLLIHRKLKHASKPYPPMAPITLMETIRTIGAVDFPFVLLDICKKMGTTTFQLPLPAFPSPIVVVVGDPDVARAVLKDPGTTKPLPLYASFRFTTAGKKHSLFSSNGDYWHSRRKGAAPAFSAIHIKRMNTLAIQKAEEWIETKLRPKILKGESFDPGEEMLSVLMMAIAETGFEYKINEEESQAFRSSIQLVLVEFTDKQSVNPFRPITGWFDSSRREAIEATHRIQNLLLKIMSAYRARENPTPGTIIDLIMKNPTYKDDAERVADLSAFLFAGYDTTAYAIAWTMREVAKNLEFQTQLRNELRSLPTAEQSKSDLLHMATREAMRLYPVAPIGSIRKTARDFTTGDGKLIPKGAVCFFSFFVTFRDDKIYQKADTYNPLRWKNATNEMNTSYYPFSMGKQNCVGQSLANAELHCILARILSEFELTLVEEGEPLFHVTFRPSGTKLKARKI